MKKQRCPRCGGTPRKPRPALAPGENPWLYRPDQPFPLCSYPGFHR